MFINQIIVGLIIFAFIALFFIIGPYRFTDEVYKFFLLSANPIDKKFATNSNSFHYTLYLFTNKSFLVQLNNDFCQDTIKLLREENKFSGRCENYCLCIGWGKIFDFSDEPLYFIDYEGFYVDYWESDPNNNPFKKLCEFNEFWSNVSFIQCYEIKKPIFYYISSDYESVNNYFVIAALKGNSKISSKPIIFRNYPSYYIMEVD